VLCGHKTLPDAARYCDCTSWLSATRKMTFDRLTDELLAALDKASDGEALDVLTQIGAVLIPQKGP
jgi:hypothetical protein